MKIITPEQVISSPWKNGGGMTHEYAREPGPKGYAWRISLAEMGEDGPFSAFPGMARILTVVQGGGLVVHTPDGKVDAPLLSPVSFAGDVPVEGKLPDGPVHNFNLIYDPACVAAMAHVLYPGGEFPCPQIKGRTYALYVVRGSVFLRGERVGEHHLALYAEALGGVRLETGGVALVLELDQL